MKRLVDLSPRLGVLSGSRAFEKLCKAIKCAECLFSEYSTFKKNKQSPNQEEFLQLKF